MTRTVVVRVPASTSNLGGGFDCVGAAVDLWLTATVQLDDDLTSPVVECSGTLAALHVAPSDDCLVAGFRAASATRGLAAVHNLRAHVRSDIPIGRGLGSSAAATVAGAVAANTLLGLEIDDRELFRLCAALERHPDNVAPAIFGGVCLVVEEQTGFVAPLIIHPNLALVFAIPDFAVETVAARRVLPAHVPHATAARAASRAAALVRGLETADSALLATGLKDVLHVPFREALVPGLAHVVEAARCAGAFGATLSGSGSAIVAIATRARVSDVATAMCRAWSDLNVRATAFVNPRQVPGYSADLQRIRQERPQMNADDRNHLVAARRTP